MKALIEFVHDGQKVRMSAMTLMRTANNILVDAQVRANTNKSKRTQLTSYEIKIVRVYLEELCKDSWD